MIHNIQQVRSIVESAIDGPCYLEYPQQPTKGRESYAILSLVDSTPLNHDAEHGEIMAELTYNVHVFARSQTDVLDKCTAICDRLSLIDLHRVSITPGWSDPVLGPMRTLTLTGILDRRGQTYTR